MIDMRLMTAADVDFGMHLKSQAGWNQTLEDWQRFSQLSPDGCFVAQCDGQDAGTVGTYRFGDVAWIGMVLVEQSFRGRGIGTALMRHALDHLDRQGVRTVRLDATDLGRPLYLKLSFADQYRLMRYEGTLPPAKAQERTCPVFQARWLGEVMALDRAVTRTQRDGLVTRLVRERPQSSFVLRAGERVTGYATARPGANAWQLGPCIADAACGGSLLDAVADTIAGQRVFVDVPTDHAGAAAWCESHGLTVQRSFTRMCRGQWVNDDVSRLWASSGPEKG